MGDTNHESMTTQDYLLLAKELRALGATAFEIGDSGVKVSFGPPPPTPQDLLEAVLEKDDVEEDDLYLSGARKVGRRNR